MSEAELKLSIFRAIDQLSGESLYDLYQYVLEVLKKEEATEDNELEINSLELGYASMSQDVEREKEAIEWIEGTLNTEDL